MSPFCSWNSKEFYPTLEKAHILTKAQKAIFMLDHIFYSSLLFPSSHPFGGPTYAQSYSLLPQGLCTCYFLFLEYSSH